MKNLSLCFFVTFMTIGFLYGQDSNVSDVKEEIRFMSQGEQNAFSIVVKKADLRSTSSYWEKYARRFKGKTKVDRKTGETFTDNAKVPEISTNTVDIYARFAEQSTKEIIIYTWYDLGGAYVNSEGHPEKSQQVSTILAEFARFVAKNQAEVILQLEEKSLKDLEKDLDKLKRENTQMHEKIEDAQALIANLENEIKLNLETQAAKKSDVTTQLKVVDSAKGEVANYK